MTRKVNGGSCEGVTEEEVAGDRGAEAEQAAGGSYGGEVTAVAEEEGAVEVFPAVFCGVVNERRRGRGGVFSDHEEPRVSRKDSRASELEGC